MKLSTFPDLHLEAAFSWTGARDPEAARRRRRGLRETLERILRLATEERADALLCGGDLYEHDRFTPDTVQFVSKAFAEADPSRFTRVRLARNDIGTLSLSKRCLGLVYRELRAHQSFQLSSAIADTVKVPRVLIEHLTDTLCYAA